MKLIIYGAGNYGRRLLFLLRHICVTPYCFCQTEVKDGQIFEGLPVISFEELLNMEEKLTIFIAIGDKNVSKNIRLRLSSIFLEQAEIIDCMDFLKSIKSIPGGILHIVREQCGEIYGGGIRRRGAFETFLGTSYYRRRVSQKFSMPPLRRSG